MPYRTQGPDLAFRGRDAVTLAMWLGAATVLGVLALCVLVIAESGSG